MNCVEKQVFLGSMCGDGSINLRNNKLNFTESHCMEQKEYLLWKQKMLKSLYLKYNEYDIFKKEYKDPNYKVCYVASPNNNELSPYRNMFYPNGVRYKT